MPKRKTEETMDPMITIKVKPANFDVTAERGEPIDLISDDEHEDTMAAISREPAPAQNPKSLSNKDTKTGTAQTSAAQTKAPVASKAFALYASNSLTALEGMDDEYDDDELGDVNADILARRKATPAKPNVVPKPPKTPKALPKRKNSPTKSTAKGKKKASDGDSMTSSSNHGSLKADIDDLHGAYVADWTRLWNTEDELAELKQETAAQAAEIEQLKTKLQQKAKAMTANAKEQREQTKEKDDEIERLKTLYDSVDRKYQARDTMLDNKHKAELRTKDDEIAKLAGERKEVQVPAVHQDATTFIATLQSNVAAKQAEIDRVSAEYESFKKATEKKEQTFENLVQSSAKMLDGKGGIQRTGRR